MSGVRFHDMLAANMARNEATLISDGTSILSAERKPWERAMPSILKPADYETCLVTFFFGRGEDYISLCHKRAYRDMQRTLDGIGKLEKGKAVRQQANAALSRMFEEIRKMPSPTQVKFDNWHRAACKELKEIYANSGYKFFRVGQAQKWLNMTFKYIFVMGDQRIGGFDHLYDFCHVPLDNVLLEAIDEHHFQPLDCAWSQLDDYRAYLERQRWFRTRFDIAPLDVEFFLWLGKPLPQSSAPKRAK